MSRVVLAWARRWLDPDDVRRVVEPAVADWQHEGRGALAVLRTIVVLVLGERWALAKQAPWWLLAFPMLAAVLGIATMNDGSAALQGLWVVVGALAFGLVVTTPTRWLTPTWSWIGVLAVVLLGFVGLEHQGATRWLALGPVQVWVTVLALPLIVTGPKPATWLAAAAFAAAPDALAGSALALARPHPLTVVGAIVALVREPAMVEHLGAAPIAIVAAGLMTVVAARWWRLPEGRMMLGLMIVGAITFGLGHGPFPLASYGGSPIVAICMGFAFAIRRSRGWTPVTEVG